MGQRFPLRFVEGTVEIWNGQNVFAHNCKLCGIGYKVRGNKRKYPYLCGRCAISFAKFNDNRKRRGQKPLSLNDYRCGQIAKRVYTFLAKH